MKFAKTILTKTGTLFIIFLAVFSLSGIANATEKKVKWKLAMTWGSNLPPFTDTVTNMTKMVETMSGGNFTIRIDSSNKHKSPFGVLDMVKLGQYDMGHSASYYWKGKDLALLPLTTMPFGMTTPEQYAWFYYGGGMELMRKLMRNTMCSLFLEAIPGNKWEAGLPRRSKAWMILRGLK